MDRPGVLPHTTPCMEGHTRPMTSGALDGNGPRSIYISVNRNFLTTFFLAFDYPIPFSAIGRRSVSNVPAQALTLMNSAFVAGQAKLWARRVLEDAGASNARRITEMYLTAFARPPSDDELADTEAFLEAQRAHYSAEADDPRVWADLGHVLINVKEFIFVQ